MTKYKTNEIYTDLSPTLKVALSVLEQGLELKSKKLSYSQEKGISWLSKLSRDLKDQVSRATIDQSLDHLLDKGILAHGKEIMKKVGNDSKWVRAYHIGNEFIENMLSLYKATHEIGKDIIE
jgi:hypothetical protein